MIVVDSSIVINALTDVREPGRIARRRLDRERDVAAPQLLDLEVLSGLRRLVTRGVVTRHDARLALGELGELDLDRWDHRGLIHRVWELRDNLSSYDAAYVALAEELRCPLLTGDARLAKGVEHARSPAPVELLTG